MYDYRTIKNIIFDLGGVLLNLDYSLTTKAFNAIAHGFGTFDATYTDQSEKQLFEDFEKGLLTAKQFRDRIRKLLLANVDDETINTAWNAMLLDFPEERLSLLKKLRSNYRLYLLSNTNEIHIQAYTNILNSTFGLANLSGIFEKEYYSYSIGMRKPDKEIFQYVLSENKLSPSNTLFIDDSIQHIAGANELGIQTLFLDKGKNIVEELLVLT